MNGGMPSRSIARPLTSPMHSPSAARPIAMPMLTPLASIIANTTPVSPATAPTDRSIPARMMANSSPYAMIASVETWRIMLKRLPESGNTASRTPATPRSARCTLPPRFPTGGDGAALSSTLRAPRCIDCVDTSGITHQGMASIDTSWGLTDRPSRDFRYLPWLPPDTRIDIVREHHTARGREPVPDACIAHHERVLHDQSVERSLTHEPNLLIRRIERNGT